jgi:hypothetical protein
MKIKIKLIILILLSNLILSDDMVLIPFLNKNGKPEKLSLRQYGQDPSFYLNEYNDVSLVSFLHVEHVNDGWFKLTVNTLKNLIDSVAYQVIQKFLKRINSKFVFITDPVILLPDIADIVSFEWNNTCHYLFVQNTGPSLVPVVYYPPNVPVSSFGYNTELNIIVFNPQPMLVLVRDKLSIEALLKFFSRSNVQEEVYSKFIVLPTGHSQIRRKLK